MKKSSGTHQTLKELKKGMTQSNERDWSLLQSMLVESSIHLDLFDFVTLS